MSEMVAGVAREERTENAKVRVGGSHLVAPVETSELVLPVPVSRMVAGVARGAPAKIPDEVQRFPRPLSIGSNI